MPVYRNYIKVDSPEDTQESKRPMPLMEELMDRDITVDRRKTLEEGAKLALNLVKFFTENKVGFFYWDPPKSGTVTFRPPQSLRK
jgi:hypothetical protein